MKIFQKASRKLNIFNSINTKLKKWILTMLIGLFLSANLTPIMAFVSQADQEQDFLTQPTPNLEELNIYHLSQTNHSASIELEQAYQYYEQGNLQQARQSFEAALAKLSQQEQSEKIQHTIGITLTNLGKIKLELGQIKPALDNLQEAEKIYQNLGQKDDLIRNQIYQAQGLQQLGYYPQVCAMLTQSLNQEQINFPLCQNSDLTPQQQTQITNHLVKLTQINLQDMRLSGWRILADNLRMMGEFKKSELILSTLEANLPSSSLKMAVQLSLGNTLQAQGDLEWERQAESQYQYHSWVCLGENQGLDNNQDSLTKYQQAISQYQASLAVGNNLNSINQLKSQVNLLELFLKMTKRQLLTAYPPEIRKLYQSAKDSIDKLPNNQFKVYSQLQLLKQNICSSNLNQPLLPIQSVSDNFQQILQLAQQIDDDIAQSYLLGNWGEFEEFSQTSNLKSGIDLTQAALYLAQKNDDYFLAYQWKWQLGRLLSKQGNQQQAIKTYQSAIEDLTQVRNDLLKINTDIQFSFRDQVEPLYLELIELLLEEKEPQKWLEAAYYKDALQLAELANFLQCNPQDFLVSPQEEELTLTSSFSRFEQQVYPLIDQASNTAIIYPIITNNQLKVLLLSKDKLSQKTAFNINTIKPEPVTASQLNHKVEAIRNALSQNPIENKKFQQLSQDLYQWLIRPIATELEQSSEPITTLVFVLDSSLQNIPMASLYDGNQYLIEQYAVVHAPSLQLLSPQSSSQNQMTALVTGASNAPSFKNLDPLLNVTKELQTINKMIPNNTLLIDEEFIQGNIKHEMSEQGFSLVHIATHGTFSSDPQETYLLDWNQPINVRQLEKLLRCNPINQDQLINLLVLSACETAKGDRRAALGIAGMALRVGVKSAIASLWNVNDQSTVELMSYLYQNLQNPDLTKAEALRQAQLTFYYQHKDDKSNQWQRAYYWTPFVLVGNWQ